MISMFHTLRKYWFYSLVLFLVLFDLFNLVLSIAFLKLETKGDSGSNRVRFALQSLFWLLSSINAIFLSTYGFIYTNTIAGSFVFQQVLSLLLVALVAALIATSGPLLQYYSVGYYMFIAGGAIHAVLLITFCGLFLVARLSGNLILGHWTTNMEDLATGVQPSPTDHKFTWRGIRRRQGRSSRRGRMTQSVVRFIANALFRRIHPVETMSFAFCQHLFALGSVILLLTRSITLLTQLDNERLPSRTLVVPVERSDGTESTRISLLVRYPELRGWSMNRGDPTGVMVDCNVSVAFQSNDTTSLYNSTAQCSTGMIHTNPDASQSNSVDWFSLFTCDGLDEWKLRGRDSLYGFQYIVTTRVSGDDARSLDMPEIWLVEGQEAPDLLTPYLVPPLQPIPGMHTIFDSHYARRKSISSSALWDAISGSKPTYNTVHLYPWSQVYSLPISSTQGPGGFRLYSSGFIYWPTHLVSSSQTPQSELKHGVAGPSRLMEITEEYRASSSFDILASIGGLLALLQGVHIFLFGRPLFWGMFGTKLLTPFGFVGRFATRNFRQRLREHYSSEPISASAAERGDTQQHTGVDMTRFLLDYVLDMGPASLPDQEAQRRDPVYGQVQLHDLNAASTTLSREPSITKSVYDDSYLPPTKAR